MQLWDILGVEPTDDVAAIKRAYAAKLKLHHPEEDPEGYQRLREAYDQAVKWAKKRSKERSSEQEQHKLEASAALDTEQAEAYGRNEEPEEDEWEEDDDEDEEYDEESEQPYHVHRLLSYIERNESLNAKSPVESFLSQVESLYQNFNSRVDTNAWIELLNADVVWNVNLQSSLSQSLLDFLEEEHYYLPEDVWRLLEQAFHWKEQAAQDPDWFQGHYPKVYAYAVAHEQPLHRGYSVLLQASDLDYDAFLAYREKGLLAFLEQNYHLAASLLNQAEERFDSDPDVIRLQMECSIRLGHWENALYACNQLMKVIPDSLEAYLSRARVRLEEGHAREALQDLSRVLEQAPSHTLALSLAGNSYKKLGEPDKALEVYKRLLQADPNDIEAMLSIAEIQAQKTEELRRKGGSGKRAELKRLKVELGRTPLGFRLKRSAFLLIGGKWFTLIAILALHIFIYSSFVKHTGETPLGFIANLVKPVELKTITSTADLELLPPKVNAVKMKLSNAAYMGINEVVTKDANGKPQTLYLSTAEVEKEGLSSQVEGYLNIGYLNGDPILIVSNYKQAKDIYDNKSIEISGTVRPLESDEMLREYDKWKKKFPKAVQNPLYEKYLDSKKKKPVPTRSILPFRIYVYTFILLLYYISLSKEVRRVWRFLRYT